MDSITIIFIGIGLSMDAFAVSISSGLVIKKEKMISALKIGFLFGLFQAVMPVLGWLLAYSLRNFIAEIDHWIAFGLLLFIGCKMIYESFKGKTDHTAIQSMNFKYFLLLAIATSIDAFIVGASFAFLNILIIIPVLIIGMITFAFSFTGVFIGNLIGHFFESKIEVAGGLILIGIGIKILLEHLL
jgi:manganese efflux pump family protein